MQEFEINIRSFSDIQDFVCLATIQPFEIAVGNEHQQVSAKSFMGMISLDYSKPVFVRPLCDEETSDRFFSDASHFMIK